MFTIFLCKNVFERFAYAMTLLDKEIKFDNADEIELDRSEAAWPKDEAELNELWRKTREI